MLRQRLAVPLAVVVVAAGLAAAGILRADAAENPVAACAVTYEVQSQWNTGFTGSLVVRNTGAVPVDGWTLGFAFGAGQLLAGGWNGTWLQTGTAVSVRDAGWNRIVAPGAEVTAGFNGTWQGSNPAPAAFTLNGVACTARTATGAPAPGSPAPAATVAPTTAPATTPAAGTETCEAGGTIPAGRYWLHNNLWGQDSGTGRQCLRATRTGGTLAWSTTWKWTGPADSVKSYDSAVLGWHWGFKVADTGLPVRLNAGRTVRSAWDFKVTEKTPGALNVSYDLWLHDIADPDWQNQPTDEVMVWLHTAGGAGPVGTKQATVTIDGTKWDLYRGTIGWNVFSFVRTTDTSAADLTLTDFTGDLTARGWLPATKYLSSVQAGTEIFTGEGRLDTSAYSVTID